MNHGINEGIHSEDYFEYADAVSHSDLKKFANPSKRIGRTSAVLGHALHSALLEPELFVKEYACILENPKLNTKAGKDRMREIQEEFPGKQILRPKETAEIKALRGAVLADPDAAKILKSPGRNELSVVTALPDLDFISKCRIDIERADGKLIADIKRTNAPDKETFVESILKYGYDSQGAYYVDSYHAATGIFPQFFWICVSHQTGKCWVEQLSPYNYHSGRRWYRDIAGIYGRQGVFGSGLSGAGDQQKDGQGSPGDAGSTGSA